MRPLIGATSAFILLKDHCAIAAMYSVTSGMYEAFRMLYERGDIADKSYCYVSQTNVEVIFWIFDRGTAPHFISLSLNLCHKSVEKYHILQP